MRTSYFPCSLAQSIRIKIPFHRIHFNANPHQRRLHPGEQEAKDPGIKLEAKRPAYRRPLLTLRINFPVGQEHPHNLHHPAEKRITPDVNPL